MNVIILIIAVKIRIHQKRTKGEWFLALLYEKNLKLGRNGTLYHWEIQFLNIVTENDTNEGPNDGDTYDALDYKLFSNVNATAQTRTSDKGATGDLDETTGESAKRNPTSNMQVLESSPNPYYDGSPL